MVTHSDVVTDPRVQREAMALLSDGWAVDIICLRGDGVPGRERWNGARVYRLPIRRHRGSGLVRYFYEYLCFFVLATLKLGWLGLGRRYDLVQAHNVPDFLVFTALLPRLRGARVVLDIRDPLPDLYTSKFGGNQRHPIVRVLRLIEARSAAFADHVLTPGEPSSRRIAGRGVPRRKLTSILNSADPRLFRPVQPPPATPDAHGRFTLVYHGGLFERYGLDVAIHAVHQLRDALPGLQLRLGGYGEEEEHLKQLVNDLRLSERIEFGGWIPPEQIREFVRGADLGIVPYRQDSFTDLIYPTKAFEYIAMGLPVIMSRLAGVVELFPDVPDLFVRPNDVDDLAARIFDLYSDRTRLHRLNEATQRAYLPYNWDGQRRSYLSLVRRLVA